MYRNTKIRIKNRRCISSIFRNDVLNPELGLAWRRALSRFINWERSVSDLHSFQCGSGSSFLPRCVSRSGSRDPNQCGSGCWSDSKNKLFLGNMSLNIHTVRWYKIQVEGLWIRIRIPNTDPDPKPWEEDADFFWLEK
jgi:hypothetical protein